MRLVLNHLITREIILLQCTCHILYDGDGDGGNDDGKTSHASVSVMKPYWTHVRTIAISTM